MKYSKFFLFGSLVLLPVIGLTLAAAKGPQETKAKEKIERGRFLVGIGGCNDCHTPLKMGPKGPEPEMNRMLSGHPEDAHYPPPPKLSGPWFAATAGMTAWAGPWGISYAANLTPDQNTGLGIWTEEMFVKAMKTGKHFGVGREILPPMPWRALASLSEADLRAIYAYLRSIPPVKNHVPDPVFPSGPME